MEVEWISAALDKSPGKPRCGSDIEQKERETGGTCRGGGPVSQEEEPHMRRV